MGLAIRNVLARRTNGAKGERRVTAPTPRNGDKTSDSGLCACCRDRFPVGGDALVDCLAPRFRFSWPSCELGEERSLVGWDDGDLEGLEPGISIPLSWHKCYGVCSAIEGNAPPEMDAWKGGTGKK